MRSNQFIFSYKDLVALNVFNDDQLNQIRRAIKNAKKSKVTQKVLFQYARFPIFVFSDGHAIITNLKGKVLYLK